jgi:hypothetical protein
MEALVRFARLPGIESVNLVARMPVPNRVVGVASRLLGPNALSSRLVAWVKSLEIVVMERGKAFSHLDWTSTVHLGRAQFMVDLQALHIPESSAFHGQSSDRHAWRYLRCSVCWLLPLGHCRRLPQVENAK